MDGEGKLKDVLSSLEDVKVLDRSIERNLYMPIDLSSSNRELEEVDMSTPEGIENHINTKLSANNKKIAFGGYLERRNLYNRSSHFTHSEESRNVHLGVDLWCPAGTAVLAAHDGIIHSFRNNNNFGDYGPTIILEHDIEGETFYSLYGHLSLESIADKSVGQEVKKMEHIGELGASEVNGDYAPHLHFQLIIDLEGNHGDYPGVASEERVGWYKQNCPDPTIMLGLK